MATAERISTNRDTGLDFARAVAAIGIVTYHFYCHSSSAHKLFLNYANGYWGSVLNFLFFALSGYLLHSKYGAPGKLTLKTFYYKRWKATMPAHLAVFLFPFCMNVFSAGELFYLDIPKWRLALSFIGMDGYAAWIVPTYYITGEWFLGAILMAYLFYPLLRWIANCRWLNYLFLGILIALYCWVLRVDFLGLYPTCNPITCLLCFYVGMLASRYTHIIKNKHLFLPALILCGVLFTVPVGGETITKMMVAGGALLIALCGIGRVLCKNKIICRITLVLSSLSYSVFLIHHRIILKVLEGFDSASTLRSLGALALILAVTFILAAVLDHLIKSLFQSKFYTKFEGLFLKGKKE